MDVDGRVLSTFTDVVEPRHLSIDSEGRVLVADWDNDRILLLSSQLQLQRVVIDNIHSQVKLRWPKRLYYNELTSLLYVTHSSSEEQWLLSDIISVFSLH